MLRLHVPLPVPAPERWTLEGERFHYLAHVLRVGVGTELEVFDGQGRAFAGRVETLEGSRLTLSLRDEHRTPPVRALVLVQGLPKADKLEWILQKGTELGASGFAPVACERSIVKLAGDKAEERRGRWEKIVQEAARQCGRSEVPSVRAVTTLKAAATALAPTHRLLVLDEEERTARLGEVVRSLEASVPLALVVGPEGGLTRAEVQGLATLGALPVTLGGLILRTETAGLAGLSVVRHLDGLLG